LAVLLVAALSFDIKTPFGSLHDDSKGIGGSVDVAGYGLHANYAGGKAFSVGGEVEGVGIGYSQDNQGSYRVKADGDLSDFGLHGSVYIGQKANGNLQVGASGQVAIDGVNIASGKAGIEVDSKGNIQPSVAGNFLGIKGSYHGNSGEDVAMLKEDSEYFIARRK